MDDEVELTSGHIAVAGTRPPLVPGLGIPWLDTTCFFVAVSGSLFIKPQLLIAIIPFFLWMLRLYSRDYNAGRVLLCYLCYSALHFSGVLGGTFMTPCRYRQYQGSLR